jgi:hypothetical protein
MLSTLSKWLGFRRRPQRPHRTGTVRTGQPRRWVPQLEMLETRLTPSTVTFGGFSTAITEINNELVVLHVNGDGSTAIVTKANGRPDFVFRGTDHTHSISLTNSVGLNFFTVDNQDHFTDAAITTNQSGQQQVKVGGNMYTLTNDLFQTKALLMPTVQTVPTETVTIANNTNSLAGISGWTVNGGPQSTLKVLDTGSSSNADYQLVDNQLNLNSNLIATYTGFQVVDLSTSTGSNVVSVKTAAPNTDIKVTGGAGGTSFNIGAGNLDAIAGFHVTVNGRGSANDVVTIDDSNATAGQTYQIGSFNVDTTVVRGRLRVTSSNVQSLTLNGASRSTYNVDSTAVPTTLNGIGSFNIGTNTGNLDFLRGHLTVHGIDANVSQVVFLDNGSNANNTYTITANAVTRDRFAGLTYDNVAGLTLDRRVGNDVYNVLSTSTLTRLSHVGGTNTFNIGNGNLDALGGRVTVSGNGGTNAVVVNDNTAPSFANYAISSTSVTRPGFAGLTYAGVQSLTLNGGSAGAVYTVTSTSSSTPITLNGGAGTSTFNIGTGILDALTRQVTVNGNGGTNAVVVNDNANDTGFTYTISSNAVTKAGFGGLTYASVQSLTLNGASLNTYIVASTSVSTTLSATASTFRINDLDRVGDHLTVHGIDGRSTLTLSDNSNANHSYTITADAVTRDRSAGLTYDQLAALSLEHVLGDDVYNVLSTSTSTRLSHRSGGASTFNIGTGNLDLLRGDVSASGSIFFAPTVVNVNDQGAAAGQTYTVTRDTVTRTGAAAIHYSGTQIPTGGPTALALSAGNLGNTINLQSMTDATRLATINPGAAGDRITITNGGHALDGIGSVSVQDAFGASTLTVDDSGFAGNDAYGITASAITLGRSSAFRVAYLGIANLNFVGGSGSDRFFIDATSANTTVQGGAGGNVFDLAAATGSLAKLAGPLQVNGGGADALVFFDAANPQAETYTFDAVPSQLTLTTVPVSVHFSGMASVFLETNGFSTVNDPSGTVLVDMPPP